jgi:hypothetical protein
MPCPTYDKILGCERIVFSEEKKERMRESWKKELARLEEIGSITKEEHEEQLEQMAIHQLTQRLEKERKEQKKATKDFLKFIEKTDISSKVKETVDEPKETPFMPQFYFKKHFPNLTQEEYDEFCERWVDERRYEEIDDIVRDTFAQWKNDVKDICVGCGENVGEVNLTEDHLGDPKCEDCFEEPLPWCYDEHTECVCGHNCAPPTSPPTYGFVNI